MTEAEAKEKYCWMARFDSVLPTKCCGTACMAGFVHKIKITVKPGISEEKEFFECTALPKRD